MHRVFFNETLRWHDSFQRRGNCSNALDECDDLTVCMLKHPLANQHVRYAMLTMNECLQTSDCKSNASAAEQCPLTCGTCNNAFAPAAVAWGFYPGGLILEARKATSGWWFKLLEAKHPPNRIQEVDADRCSTELGSFLRCNEYCMAHSSCSDAGLGDDISPLPCDIQPHKDCFVFSSVPAILLLDRFYASPNTNKAEMPRRPSRARKVLLKLASSFSFGLQLKDRFVKRELISTESPGMLPKHIHGVQQARYLSYQPMRAIWPLQFLSSRQCSANPSRGGKESSSHAARVPSKSSAHAHEEDAEGEQRAQRVAQVAARLQLPPLKRGSHCQKKNKSRK
ncbi:MAG: hypothetical protein SGPRY_005837, partial [Prymnesium sp.]